MASSVKVESGSSKFVSEAEASCDGVTKYMPGQRFPIESPVRQHTWHALALEEHTFARPRAQTQPAKPNMRAAVRYASSLALTKSLLRPLPPSRGWDGSGPSMLAHSRSPAILLHLALLFGH